jgi:hypothetical protein
MANELDVDPDQIRTAASGVTSASGTLQAHAAGFEQQIAGQSDAFGDDDLGSLIQGCHQAICGLAFGSYHDNTEALQTDANNLHAMAANYDDGEQANTAEVNNVRKVLG